MVAPLLALTADYINILKKAHIEYINCTSSKSQSDADAIRAPVKDSLRVILTTPESLLQNNNLIVFVRSLIEEGRVHRVVVDEAHVVLTWGPQFRPAYVKLLSEWSNIDADLAYTFMSATLKSTDILDLADISKIDAYYILSCEQNK